MIEFVSVSLNNKYKIFMNCEYFTLFSLTICGTFREFLVSTMGRNFLFNLPAKKLSPVIHDGEQSSTQQKMCDIHSGDD